jgi:hypothetical protein
MSSQRSHTRTKCLRVSLAVIASVVVTSSTAWGQTASELFIREAKLTVNDGATHAFLGRKIGVSGDTAVFAGEDLRPEAYVFSRDDAGAWSHEATLAVPAVRNQLIDQPRHDRDRSLQR